jgi:hypothetical protein
MTTLPTVARLICKRGELAGSRFELGTDNTIGRDERDRIVVATNIRPAPSLRTRCARIYFDGGNYYLENAGGGTDRVTLDGTAIIGAVQLNRLHLIGLSGNTEFLFTRSASGSTPIYHQAHGPRTPLQVPIQLPPAPPAPSKLSSVPWASDSGSTIVDAAGFSALPELHELEAAPVPRTVPADRSQPAPDSYDEVDQRHPAVKRTDLLLTVTLPIDGPTSFALKYGDNTIGRSEACEIRIVDPEKWLSRRHAIIQVSDNGVELIDLNGKNGTFVHGERITTASLVPGSTFVLGGRLEFTLLKQ